ncbi:hypothetical protein [Peribacillus simplex]|uniref:hypothetical protein n=1 Tax=Peribacillus simplex TaxID=1478 RepID=UPI0036724941
MKITDEAKHLLVNVLNENGAEGIRLYSVAGCCGPQMALSLDAHKNQILYKPLTGLK